jgi:hypothetical protein
MSLFEPVDSANEAALLKAADKPRGTKKGPDYSIRTVTHWFTFSHHMGYCTVPSHYDNVPDTDHNGEPYDKYPTRSCVTIGKFEVCRWCYVAEADVVAELENAPPVIPDESQLQKLNELRGN